MYAKNYFQRVARAERDLRTITARIRHYQELGLLSPPPDSQGAPGGTKNPSSRVETAAIGIVDTTAALMARAAEYQRMITEAETVINQLSQDNFRRILELHYLCGMSLSSVSDEMRYRNPNSIYRAHSWALRAAQPIIDSLPEPGQ